MFLVAAAAHLAIVLYSRTTLAASVWQVTRAEKKIEYIDIAVFFSNDRSSCSCLRLAW